MSELINVANQFAGLDMATLIGGPLKAACDAQSMLARSTLNFINEVGLDQADQNGVRKVRTTSFSFERASDGGENGEIGSETVTMNVPLLAIVNVPALSIDKVSVTFDMEVKSSTSSESKRDSQAEMEANAGVKFGCFHMDVHIKGSVSCHDSNTRSSDNSAKYHVSVEASQQKTPEGLLRMLDMLSSAVAPQSIKAGA